MPSKLFFKNFYAFDDKNLDLDMPPHEIEAAVSRLNGNLDGSYQETQHLLTTDECTKLLEYGSIKHAEILKNPHSFHYSTSTNITDDVRFEIPFDSLVSKASIDRVRSAFEKYCAVSMPPVLMRQSRNNGQRSIPFHNDGPFCVMHIYLEAKTGGHLHYLTHKGVVPTQVPPGSGILHSQGIVHGVTPFEGSRTMLVLMKRAGSETTLSLDVHSEL